MALLETIILLGAVVALGVFAWFVWRMDHHKEGME
jgi:hypothetical protein